jgi:hypothetical protein
MPQTIIVGAAVYIDPLTGITKCSYCDQPVAASAVERSRLSTQAQAPQIWCANKECKAYNVMGDVEITTLPGTKHQSRPPFKIGS